jgi:putative oxidoreductase
MAGGKLSLILRILLGLILLLFGFNGFFQFMPMPEMGTAATDLMMALFGSGYIMQVVNALKIVIGLMLLFNKYIPFALVLLAPLSLNFVLFHLFLDFSGIGAAALVFVLNVYLAYVYRDAYASLFE